MGRTVTVDTGAHGGAPRSAGRLGEFARSSSLSLVLSIFLRERGSPQSKPVAMPHHETGG